MKFKLRWPRKFNELQKIESVLQCRVCHKTMEEPVTIICLHSFCSRCISKATSWPLKCPVCLQNFGPGGVSSNEPLGIIIKYLNMFKTKLLTAVAEANVNPTKTYTKKRNHKDSQSSPSSVGAKRMKLSDPQQLTVDRDRKYSGTSITSGSSASKMVSTLDLTKKKPICKPLSKCVLRLMGREGLQKKLLELDLPTEGDRNALEQRYYRYWLFYKLACDQNDPYRIIAFVEHCKNLANLEKRKSEESQNRLKITRDIKNGDRIEEARKKYHCSLEKNLSGDQLPSKVKENKSEGYFSSEKTVEPTKGADSATTVAVESSNSVFIPPRPYITIPRNKKPETRTEISEDSATKNKGIGKKEKS